MVNTAMDRQRFLALSRTYQALTDLIRLHTTRHNTPDTPHPIFGASFTNRPTMPNHGENRITGQRHGLTAGRDAAFSAPYV
jgi:hypothetical protein